MRTKNKMKDFEAKYEEWWEVIEEYFTKELEKNLAQYRTNEQILKYKLEAYQQNFPDFIMVVKQIQRYRAKMKRHKQGLMEQFRRKKCKLWNHMTLEVEQLRRRRYNQINHRTLEEGVKKRKL